MWLLSLLSEQDSQIVRAQDRNTYYSSFSAREAITVHVFGNPYVQGRPSEKEQAKKENTVPPVRYREFCHGIVYVRCMNNTNFSLNHRFRLIRKI